MIQTHAFEIKGRHEPTDLGLRGSTPLGRAGRGSYLSPEYLASFATAPGLVSLLMFVLFAAMPTIVARAGRNRVGEFP